VSEKARWQAVLAQKRSRVNAHRQMAVHALQAVRRQNKFIAEGRYRGRKAEKERKRAESYVKVGRTASEKGGEGHNGASAGPIC